MNTLRMKMLLMLLLFLGGGVASFAQEQLKISGAVKDAKSKPLSGVLVTVKGTSLSTHTDFDGLYTLTLSKNANAGNNSYFLYCRCYFASNR